MIICDDELKNTRSGASPAWCFLAFSWIADVSTAAMRRCVLLADVACGVVISVVITHALMSEKALETTAIVVIPRRRRLNDAWCSGGDVDAHQQRP